MGLRDRILRRLERGRAEPDPDEYVEFAVVRVEAGPMLVAQLRAAGLDAIGSDAFNVATLVASDYRVMVMRRDLGAATQVAGQP